MLHILKNLVLCGDFNSRPDGEVYKLLCSGFLSAYCGFELVVTTCSNARSNDGAGFAETIDYCWMARASAAALRRRLRLPTKGELRELLKGSPEPAREHNKVGQLWVGGYFRHLR